MYLSAGIERLEFLTISAYSNADLRAPITQVVKRGNLLGSHNDIATHRQHQHARAETKPLRVRSKKSVGHQGLPETRGHLEFGPNVMLGGHVIVTPDRVIAERFSALRDLDQCFGIGKRYRVCQPFHSS